MKHVKNAHMGQHLLLEVYNVPFEKLNDPQKIEETMVRAVEIEGLTILNTFSHQFDRPNYAFLFLRLYQLYLSKNYRNRTLHDDLFHLLTS